MTKDKHVFAIKNILYSGPITDDARYSNKLIEHFLNIVRVTLIKRRLDKEHSISKSFYQIICMPLVKANLSECSECMNLPDECNLLRSKYEVPKTINDRWGEVLKVRTFDGKEISYLPITSLQYHKYGETNDPFFFIYNKYVFVVGINIKAVLIEGLFEEPDEVANYNICNDQGEVSNDPCYNPINDSYPLDTDLAPTAYKMVIDLIMPYAFIKDSQNNSTDDTSAVVKGK